MSKINDLKDKQFSYLTVLNRADDKFTSKGKRLIMWECKCVCGKIKIVTSGKLTSGHVKLLSLVVNVVYFLELKI